jgi:hypothetical protein
MANSASRKRPKDVRRSLEQWALDHGRVFIVLRVSPDNFCQGVTQPMQLVG